MKLRDALQIQAPSLALVREAACEIARLDAELAAAYRLIVRQQCATSPVRGWCAQSNAPCDIRPLQE